MSDPVEENVVRISANAIPGVVPYAQVAASLVVTANVAVRVPNGSVPVGLEVTTAGGVESPAGG